MIESILKLLSAVEFNNGPYPYVKILDSAKVASALQELSKAIKTQAYWSSKKTSVPLLKEE